MGRQWQATPTRGTAALLARVEASRIEWPNGGPATLIRPLLLDDDDKMTRSKDGRRRPKAQQTVAAVVAGHDATARYGA
ncbi:hypothetical protein O9K51_05111 [Purpureocillium lavendulum]|uniref:Uncharacterized protein n=1 Tax=Purpureocillium lavendulum TaxID=1247861 RepID=A0AB34FRP9_9HYPO|nr:hypothetical protein O9K51_05111 [Purpureocillium lavendulum]